MEARACSVPGCDRKYYARGYCGPHWKRFNRHGSPTAGYADHGAAARFIALAIQHQSDECLLWPYGRSGRYGQVNRPQKNYAHVLICELAHGEKPENHEAAHSCGVTLCVNPRHLRWATHKENSDDMIGHGTRVRGEKVGNSKLTAEQVQQIRAAAGRTQTDIAAEYGIDRALVSYIRARKVWSWLPTKERET